jgi:nitric oxide reductase subunit B
VNRLLPLAIACLALTVLLGLLTAVASVLGASVVDFRQLNFLHTLFALGFVIIGALGAALVVVGRPPRRSHLALFIIAIGLPAVAIMQGDFSGRKYLTWAPVFSIPLFLAIGWASLGILRGIVRLERKDPEAAWMIGIGALLLPLSFAEAHLYLIPSVGLDIGKDLAVQWHALDTIIGSWNAILYGIGAMIAAPARKPSRGYRSLLFVVAASGLLLTFSHHHYQSPQATWLKDVAFLSSLLAAIAFVHHLRKWRSDEAVTKVGVLLNMAERWTLLSVATGFLMALPALNVLVHGTYVVVAHSMGSMIGVNAILIFAAAYHQSSEPASLADRAFLRWSGAFNWSLGGFVAVLFSAGFVEGILRPDDGYWGYAETARLALSPLPVLGLAIAVLVAMIAADCLRRNARPIPAEKTLQQLTSAIGTRDGGVGERVRMIGAIRPAPVRGQSHSPNDSAATTPAPESAIQ